MGKISEQKIPLKSGEQVVLRSALPSDALAINQLMGEVFKTSDYLVTSPEEFSPMPEEKRKELIQDFAENEGHLLLVVEHEGSLIGMIDFQNGKKKRTTHKGVLGMSVLSSWRGKGIGKILLRGLVDWVKTHPFLEVIGLQVMEENAPAFALYQSLGFQTIGREPFGLKLADGRFWVELTMSLKVKKGHS